MTREQYPFHNDRAKYSADHAARMAAAVARGEAKRAHARRNERIARAACILLVVGVLVCIFIHATNGA
jgi:hypothetical protein